MRIQHENGVGSEALLLAAEEDRLRLAPVGSADAVEILRLGGQWWDENGRRVAIGAVIAIAD